MNDQDVSRLLEDRVRDVQVRPAPVERVITHGRRRLRARHAMQVGSTAVAVTAIAVTGLVARPFGLAGDTAPSHVSAASRLTGRTPTEADLLGSWGLLDDQHAAPGASARVVPGGSLTFTSRANQLRIAVEDGGTCTFWSGDAWLESHGAFSTNEQEVSHWTCRRPGSPDDFSLPKLSALVGETRWVQLSGSELRIYDANGSLIGTFLRLPGRR